VYAWVRHPIYFGWVLAVFGTPHMTGDRLAFAIVSTMYLMVAVPLEERSLRRSFGDAYVRYTRDVRWRMIPFIY
jgi:protein-S-isoprenylcysteine O-methyltransferase Ste14